MGQFRLRPKKKAAFGPHHGRRHSKDELPRWWTIQTERWGLEVLITVWVELMCKMVGFDKKESQRLITCNLYVKIGAATVFINSYYYS